MTPEEKDRYLAIHLMGWVWSDEHQMWCDGKERDADGRLTFASPNSLKLDDDDKQEPWHPSHPTLGITQALGDGGEGTVVGEMRKRGFTLDLSQFYNQSNYMCRFFDHKNPTTPSKWVFADTPAAAITDAAVRALGGD